MRILWGFFWWRTGADYGVVMGWGLPWVKKKGQQGGFVIASVHQRPNEADITDTCRDAAYVCEEHADMIIMAVNHHDELVKYLERDVRWLRHIEGQMNIESIKMGCRSGIRDAEKILAKVKS